MRIKWSFYNAKNGSHGPDYKEANQTGKEAKRSLKLARVGLKKQHAGP